jgi:hypothetical protein
VARVQSATNVDTGSTTIAVGSGQGWAAPTAGNLIVAFYNGDNTCTTPTGFSVGPSVVDNNACYCWYKVAAGTETSVSFVQSASTQGQAWLIEYSGVTATPFDVQATSTVTATSGSVTTSASVTTTGTSGALLLAVAALANTVVASLPASPTWSNGFTNFLAFGDGAAVAGGTTSNMYAFTADLTTASAGVVSTSCSWTNAMMNRQELLIAFKLAASAAAEIPILVMARST